MATELLFLEKFSNVTSHVFRSPVVTGPSDNRFSVRIQDVGDGRMANVVFFRNLFNTTELIAFGPGVTSIAHAMHALSASHVPSVAVAHFFIRFMLHWRRQGTGVE